VDRSRGEPSNADSVRIGIDADCALRAEPN
jgi:hypothetical protein